MVGSRDETRDGEHGATRDGAHVGTRVLSELERRNRSARRWRWAVAAAVTSIVVVSAASFAAFVWLLEAWIHIDSLGPYAAEPTVITVIDGDTVLVRVGRERVSVRLLGVDTPETKDPRKPVQCFGREAAHHTAELLPRGTVVRLEHDLEERDAYGRLLAYVWRASDGLFVNLDLATGGWADVLSIAPNTLYADVLRAARDEARAAPRGLWQTCGGPGRPVA